MKATEKQQLNTSDRTQVLSFGGGVQTTAMLVLVLENKLPLPDIIIMADTGREKQSTWDYLREHLEPLLKQRGIEVIVAKAADYAKQDYGVIEKSGDKERVRIPAFFADGGGKFPNFCSSKWKQRVVYRKLRELHVTRCDIWLGFTLDEIRRAKQDGSGMQWARYVYPLINGVYQNRPLLYGEDLGHLALNRQDCIRAITDFGLPEPSKSSCFMCPHLSDDQWLAISEQELQQAAAIEQEIQQVDTDEIPYLHRRCIPIMQVVEDLKSGKTEVETKKNSGDCQSGFCFL